MYVDALSFLEDEREAIRPFEQLLLLAPAQLEIPVVGPDRWSGRDLIAHLAWWLEHALEVARELAVGERSPTYERVAAQWAAGGDELNARITAEWRALSLDEVERRFRAASGELRGYLTVVPEARWLKNPEFQRFFAEETIDHYADHEADLEAILRAAS